MENVQTARASRRILAFLIDIACILAVAQILVYLFSDQFTALFHMKEAVDTYNSIGVAMGVLNPETFEPIANVSKEILKQFNENPEVMNAIKTVNNGNLYSNIICGGVGYLIFQIIIPLFLKKGRSLGKLACKLEVVKTDNSEIKVGTLLLRNFVGKFVIEFSLSLAAMLLPFVISACLVFAGDSKRSLHDYIAKTKVIEVGVAPIVQKEDEMNTTNPYHKKYKGFEYIDVEAMEKNETSKNVNEVVDNNQSNQEENQQNK